MTILAGLASALSSPAGPQNDKACDLRGDTFEVSFSYPDASRTIHDAGRFTVPASDIDPRGFGFAHIDLQDRAVIVRYTASNTFETAPFHGYVLKDLSRSDIRSVTIDGGTTVGGVTASWLTVKGDTIALNLADVSYRVGDEIRLDIGLTCDRLLISRSG